MLLRVVGLHAKVTRMVVADGPSASFSLTPFTMRCLLALLFALSAHAAPVPIFDGKSLAGWEGDAAWWRVEDGEIRGGSSTVKVPKNFFLATEKSYQNFDLRVKLRLTGTGFVNSGIQMRSVRVPNSSEMSGYQVDYGKGWYGKIYDESRRNKVIAESKDAAVVLATVKEGEWNEYRILAEGNRIRSWVNGVPALDYLETEPNIAADGKIGIQICYDSEFPLFTRALVEQGADMILVPSATEFEAGYTRVRQSCRARAIESQCLIVHSPVLGPVEDCPLLEQGTGSAAIFCPPDFGLPQNGQRH